MMDLDKMEALCDAAPDCFPLSSKGEIEAGVFYDAVKPAMPLLIAEVRKCRQALEWYSDAENYKHLPPFKRIGMKDGVARAILQDCGNKARNALGETE